MERITSDSRLRAICQAGRGVVYNDFSGRGASGAQYNVVHAASCTWLGRSNAGVAKLWFEGLAAATGWLVRERGREGQGWKRCGTCHGGGPLAATARALSPASLATAEAARHEAPPEFLVVSDPGGSRVEAWSTARLPFEPTGQMRELRGELRRAVAQMAAGPADALHAVYTSPVGGHFDVENVLLGHRCVRNRPSLAPRLPEHVATVRAICVDRFRKVPVDPESANRRVPRASLLGDSSGVRVLPR